MTILLAILGGLGFLVGLTIGIRRFGINAVLLTGYMILAPLSVTPMLPLVGVVKWGRVGLAGLLTLINLRVFVPVFRVGPSGLALLFIFVYYAAAGSYSDVPIWALLFKGQSVLTILAGVAVMMSVRSIAEFEKILYAIALGSSVLIFVAFALLISNPANLNFSGRFQPLGLNPNRLAMSMAAFVPGLVYAGLYSRNWLAKVYFLGMLSLAGIILLTTGSRGGVAMAAAYAFAAAFPVLRRPVTTLIVGSVSLGIAFLVLQLVTVDANIERVTSTEFTRGTAWTKGFTLFSESPLLGQGWTYKFVEGRGRPGVENMHSAYLNFLAETGLLGVLFCGIAFLLLIYGSLKLLLECFRYGTPEEFRVCCILGGFFGAPIFHGLVEAATLTGNTPATLLLGVGVAGLDQLRNLMAGRIDEEYETSGFLHAHEYDQDYGEAEEDPALARP